MRTGVKLVTTLSAGGRYTFTNEEAEAIVDRFATPPPRAVKVAIDNFWSYPGIKPVMAARDRFYLWKAADAQSACLDWSSNEVDCTPVGGMAFTAYRDYQGDGTTGYIDPHFNPVTEVGAEFTQNNGSLAFYSTTDTASNNVDAGNTNSILQCRSATDITAHRVNTSASNTFANTDGSGMFVVSRQLASGVGAMTLYIDGALAVTSQLASQAPADAPFRFFGRGGTVAFSARRGVMGSIGSALTAEEVAILQGAVDQYLAAMEGGPQDFF